MEETAADDKRFASLYFADAEVLKQLEGEANARKTSFNALVVGAMTQIVAQARRGRRQGRTVRTFKVVL